MIFYRIQNWITLLISDYLSYLCEIRSDQCFISGSKLDLDSISQWIRIQEGFSCSFGVLYGSIGISK
jgi:hypothetical protein